jgi:hypothetical protein
MRFFGHCCSVGIFVMLSSLSIANSATIGENLIVNGNFEDTAWDASNGHYPGFISDYTRVSNDGAYLNVEAHERNYTLAQEARHAHDAWTMAGDHTTGSGHYFIANAGSVLSDGAWQTSEAITVDETDRTYRFEAYISTLYFIKTTSGAYAPQLRFQIGDGTHWVDMKAGGALTHTFSNPTCDNNATTSMTTDDPGGSSTCSATPTSDAIGSWIHTYVDGKFSVPGNYYIRLVNNQGQVGGNDFGLDDISFTFTDSGLGQDINTSTLNKAPTITAGGTTAFTEQTPVPVTTTITVSDPDGDAEWDGGSLSVAISSNATANDSLSLPTSDPGSGGIWVNSASANELMAGATQIGSADAGQVSAGSVWTFNFNSNASNVLVQSVAQAVIFNNSSVNPDTATRTVKFTVTDNSSSAMSAEQAVTITRINSVPTSTDDSKTFTEDTTVFLTANDFGTFSDGDTTPLNNVQITTLENIGILEHSNDGSTWTDVSLNQQITKADLDANRLRYTPAEHGYGTPYETIGFKVGDGISYSSAAYTLTFNVTPDNDAPVFGALGLGSSDSTLISQYKFDGVIADTLGGDTVTVYTNDGGDPSNATQTFGTDATGSFWEWTSSNARGGGFTIDANLLDPSNYSIALRFRFNQVSSYNKIIDYLDRASDTGFYLLDGQVDFYPLGTGTTTYGSNDLVDLIATRDSATDTFTVYLSDGSGNYVKNLEVHDPGDTSVPIDLGALARFGFFYDDLDTSDEATDTGKVYEIKIWNRPLASFEVTAALGNNAVVNESDIRVTPQLLNFSLPVSDPEQNYNTGNITISFNGGGTATEALTFDNIGAGTEEIGFDGSNVSYEGTTFGTVSGGNAGNPLMVTFDGNATDAAITALIKVLKYGNTSTSPPAARQLDFSITDGGSLSDTTQATVSIIPFDDINAPTISTQAVTVIDATSATGNGNITSMGSPNPSQHGVCWNITGTPTTADSCTTEGAASATGAFTSPISGLIANTSYYVRAYAINSAGKAYGNQVSFTTLPQLPIVTTQTVTVITATSATGNGNITSMGSPNPTQHGVCWNTTGTPTTADSCTTEGPASATGAFTSPVSSLSANTSYYVRAYAINSAGTTYGGQVSFTTLSQLPTMTTQEVTAISATSATGNGNITSMGSPNPTQHGICWNTAGTPTTADNSTTEGAASATGAFTSSITGLTANTSYYVRAYAINSAGTTYGDQVSFTALAHLPTVTTQAVTAITATSATGNGNITSLSSPNPTEHGVCWNATGTPTLSDSCTAEGAATATGAFPSAVKGLSSSTAYYLRAYVTNNSGTAYGNEVSFKTAFPWNIFFPAMSAMFPKNPDFCYLIADGSNQGNKNSSLFQYQFRTNSMVLLNYLGVNDVETIAFSHDKSILYAVNNNVFGIIDSTNGTPNSFTPVNPSGVGSGNGALGILTVSDIDGMATDPVTGKIYATAISREGSHHLLIQIDSQSGAVSPDAFGTGVDYLVLNVESMGAEGIDDIAIDTEGQMFAVLGAAAGDKLVGIDKMTGALSEHNYFYHRDGGRVQDIEGLTFFDNGILFATTGIELATEGTDNTLYRIEIHSGVAEPVTRLDHNFNGYIPEDFESIECYPRR